MSKQQRVPRRVFWPLMIAGGVAVAVGYAVTRAFAVAEWLTEGPAPVAPVTDYPDQASDFPSMDQRRDG